MEPAVLQRWLDEERGRDEDGCLPQRQKAPADDGGATAAAAGVALDPAGVVTSEDIRESVFPLEVRFATSLRRAAHLIQWG